MSEQFDAVVIGAGIAGETCVFRLNAAGRRVAVIERDRVGGECAYWGRTSSQTLLGPANEVWRAQQIAGINSPALGGSPDLPHGEPTLSTQDDQLEAESLGRAGVELIRGDARISQPGQVAVGDRLIQAPCIIIATGSTPRIPDIPGLADTDYWTNREALRYEAIPQEVLLLGGEAQAVELAQMFRLYGAQVTLLTADTHLFSHEDPELGRDMAIRLRHSGVRVVLGQEIVKVAHSGEGDYAATLADTSVITAKALVVADGRDPRVDVLEGDAAGIKLGDTGIVVDEMCRAAGGVWAIGDVTGVLPLSHMAQYQAHLVADDILGCPHPGKYLSVPRIYFTDPQVAAAGLTPRRADARHINVVSALVNLRSSIVQSPEMSAGEMPGKLVLYADRQSGVLVGAWAIAPDAAEWIQVPVLAISAAIPLKILMDTVEQFPGFSQPYRSALAQLSGQLA